MTNDKLTYEELENQIMFLKKDLNRYNKTGLYNIDFGNNIDFQDIFDINEIQRIQDLFAEATGVASVITDPKGIPITKPSNFCRLCFDIIRKTEKGLENCYYSDAQIGKQNIDGAISQPCLSGGLWDGGASITVGGKHIANWLIGQVKDENLDEKKMLLYAKEIGANETEFKEALGEVSIMSAEKFKKIADTLFFFANEISQKAYQNTLQNRLITELQEKEKQLVKAKEKAEESERLKSAFLANMSHEIRTPMNGILGFTSLMQDPSLTGEKQRKYLEIIRKSGDRMLSTVNDIIDISRIESGLVELSVSEVSIPEQLNDLYSFFKPEAAKNGNQLVFNNAECEQDFRVNTDSEKLNSILTNLIKNAIKFTSQGSIEMGFCSKMINGESYVEFYVKDTGLGIQKDRQDAIFDRFVQADIEDRHAIQGSGLGLAISKAYAEMLGGKMWLNSKVGAGSTFYFTVKCNSASDYKLNLQNDNDLFKEENISEKLKILVVEDDETSGMLISIMLQELNSNILHAKDGLEAIKLCRENPDLDLIFMDVKMPIIGGYEATRQIRQFNRDVIVIAQTAYGLSGDRKKAIEAGCNDYITKPIKRHELLLLVQKYFK